MSWKYAQSSGMLWHGSALVGTCYSGHGEGLNNPDMEAFHGVGPIPAGDYVIGPPKDPQDHLGPLAMPLTPAPGNGAHGRSAFFMHGDNAAMNHTASDGCIVAVPAIRFMVNNYRKSGGDDDKLTVVA